MYAWLYPVYELACAYSTQTFVFRDLLIQLFLPPDPRLIHDWEVDFTRAPVAFESVWLKITIINRKKKSEGGGEDVISNTRPVDKSADEGVGEGGASQCWWNPRARLRLCPGHPSLPLGSTSPSSRWFKSSVEQNAGFSGTIAQKQTAQAIVIVSLNDASLKWLWKRVKNHPAKSFKTWYRTWGASLVSADTSDPRLDPQSQMCRHDLFSIYSYICVYTGWHNLQVWRSRVNLQDTASPRRGSEKRAQRGWEGGSLQRNRNQASRPQSAQLKQTVVFFVVSSFCKNLDDKGKKRKKDNVFGF